MFGESASVISLTHLGQGQGAAMPIYQGHLWGEGLAAGGRRQEDANDAHPAQELGCLWGAKEFISV